MLTDAEFEKLIKQGKVNKPEGTFLLKETKPRIYNGFKKEFTEAKYQVRITFKPSMALKERLNKEYKEFINK